MNHTPTRDGEIIACQDCSFRAILTTQGPFVRDAGDPSVDHLALLEAQRVEAERLLRGLVARYQAGAVGGLSMRQVRQYGLYIKREMGL